MKAKTFVKTAAAMTAATAGAGYVLFNEVMSRSGIFSKKVSDSVIKKQKLMTVEEPACVDERVEWFRNADFKEYSITNPRGFLLKGYLIPAEKESDVYVFCSHGYKSSKDEFRFISKFYHDMGYNVFLVDHQACGNSEGKYLGFGYHESKDCLLWLDYMKQLFGENIQIILHGISMGCATVTMMSGDAALPSNVKFVIADCGYTSCDDEFSHAIKFLHIPKFPVYYAAKEFNKVLNGFSFEKVSPLNAVRYSKVPMLFIHGGDDSFVPTYMVHQLYAACGSENKDLLIVENAKHAESYQTDSPAYEKKIKEFTDKFIK
ncbi:MAG: alpha/beta hydrolase [Clostridiales bacterium]|nr:alpha/beta hydrolase [Clostridiales bacterium]